MQHEHSVPLKTNLHLKTFSFLTQLVADPRGFIPDIIDILRKYSLHTYLLTWVTTGTFPHKYSWKTIVRSTINDFHIQQRQIRMLMDPDFHRFNSVFQHNKPCNIWSFVDNASDIRNFKFTCKLIVSTKTLCLSTCHLCNSPYEDIFCHITLSCGALSDCHNEWWNTIVNSFHIDLGVELCGLCETHLFLVVLGREPLTVLPLSQERNFRILNSKLLVRACAQYQRQCAALSRI